MRSFYWLIDGILAGCGRPGASGGQRRFGFAPKDDAQTEALDHDLDFLHEQGIGALLSLTETPLPADALARHGLASLHLPIDDLTAPTPLQLEHALAFIDEQRARNRAVAVHCLMGQGRTGTVLAAYLIRGGATVAQALESLRVVCPGAVGVAAQEQALAGFARRRDWIV